MKRILSTLFLFFLCFDAVAQGEDNIWYFGNRGGIEFNTGTVSPLGDSVMNAFEGCDTVCNADGELLFYTNGTEVYNRNHLVMSNGTDLLGGFSSTHTLIVPKPGDANIYYIFTVDDFGDTDGLRYSEVDLSLNGGLGNVTGNKNILLATPVTEKIAAIYNWLEDSYWLVARRWESDAFISYKITSSGIAETPVVSTTNEFVGLSPPSGSPLEDFDLGRSGGQMKFSPDGTKLALARGVENRFIIYDFDKLSGNISNPQLLYVNPTIDDYGQSAYGVEFSPNGRFVYFGQAGNGIFQYDLEAGSTLDIINSQIIINDAPEGLGSFQLATNNKIYITISEASKKFLDVITKKMDNQ